MQELLLQFPIILEILAGLGSLMVVGTIITGLTPSTRDDEFMAKLQKVPGLGQVLKFAQSLSPWQKTPKKK